MALKIISSRLHRALKGKKKENLLNENYFISLRIINLDKNYMKCKLPVLVYRCTCTQTACFFHRTNLASCDLVCTCIVQFMRRNFSSLIFESYFSPFQYVYVHVFVAILVRTYVNIDTFNQANWSGSFRLAHYQARWIF